MCALFSPEILQARAAKGLTKWAELFASAFNYVYIIALSGTIVL